jgi:FlaG/FlaF family flagellin (archaellin)
MKNITKFKRSIRAISPVISVLLMIAVAVVASLVAYAWVMGYIGFQSQNTGQAIQIPSYAPGADSGHMKVYVQNVGQGAVTVGEVYINDALAASSGDKALSEGETSELTVTLPTGVTWSAGEQVKIKVTTTSGTFMTVSGTGSSGGSGSGPSVIAASLTITAPPAATDYSVPASSTFTVTAPISLNTGSISVSALLSVPLGYTVTSTNPLIQTASTTPMDFVWTVQAPSAQQDSAQVTLTASAAGYTDGTGSFNVATDAPVGPGPATKLVFTVGTTQTFITDIVSNVITVQRQDANGIPTTTGQINVAFSSNGGDSDHFYSDQAMSDEIYGNEHLHIIDGQSSVNFYYMDIYAEGVTITASSNGLFDASLTIQVNAPQSTGQKDPSSETGNWNRPTRAYTDNTEYSDSATNGQVHTFGSYGVTIPSNAIVTSVIVRMDAWVDSSGHSEDLKLEVSADGGTNFLTATSTKSLTSSQTAYYVDITQWAAWNSVNVNQISTRVTHISTGGLDTIRLDWIPIEVQYYVP